MRSPSFRLFLMALALLSPATAMADGVFHPTGQSYACVNPRATRALANHADPRQNDPGRDWRRLFQPSYVPSKTSSDLEPIKNIRFRRAADRYTDFLDHVNFLLHI